MDDMVVLGHAMKTVEFPAMRREVIGALASLADRPYQDRAWLRQDFDVDGTFEDLDLIIHILYDDTEILPDPRPSIGPIIFDGEASAFHTLGSALTPLLDRLGDAPVNDYLESDEWPAVVQAAGIALATMIRHGYFGP